MLNIKTNRNIWGNLRHFETFWEIVDLMSVHRRTFLTQYHHAIQTYSGINYTSTIFINLICQLYIAETVNIVHTHYSLVRDMSCTLVHVPVIYAVHKYTYNAAFNENGVNCHAFSHRKTQCHTLTCRNSSSEICWEMMTWGKEHLWPNVM